MTSTNLVTVTDFDASFKLGKLLGKGGFARVYEGEHRQTKSQVAVKIFFNKSMDGNMVQNEIQALRCLHHPNIVRLLDLFSDNENTFLCLEKVIGGELFHYLTRTTSQYNETTARDLCKIILSAIEHCHCNNVIHRDIKPENIVMISKLPNAGIKLIDFGLSIKTTGLVVGRVGTLIYNAPEIWNNNAYGKAVDMWAVGVVVFLLLWGYHPFAPLDASNIVTARIVREPQWSKVSPEAKDFVSRLLSKNASCRLSSSDALEHPWVS